MTLENTETAGGTRYSAGKPRMWMSPWLGMLEVARVSEYGAEKYAPLDWQAGQSFSTLLSCGMRHLIRAMDNPTHLDPESGRYSLGHAAWNVLALLHFLEEGRAAELDDVTPWRGVTAASSVKRPRADRSEPYERLLWETTHEQVE